MHIRRLSKLADILEDHVTQRKGEDFDLERWKCGHAACAIGHAILSGQFREEGFERGDCSFTPIYAGLTGWMAVREFFELDRTQVEYLFAASEYDISEGEIAERQVIDRIRAFVELEALMNSSNVKIK